MATGGPHDTSPLGTGNNWVTKVGGLPLYIREIAHALIRNGHTESQAIQLAIGTVQRWARGEGKVTAATRAKAAKALAEWEAKRAAAHALSVGRGPAVELAADPSPMPHRYRHGWIPVGPGAKPSGHMPTATPAQHPMGPMVSDVETGVRAVMADGHARMANPTVVRGTVERLRSRGVAARVEPVTVGGKRHVRVFDPNRRQPVNLATPQGSSVDLAGVWDESKHPRKGGKFAPKGTTTEPAQPKPAGGLSVADAKGLGLPTDPKLRAAYIQAYQLLTGQPPTGVLDAAGMAKMRAAIDPNRDGSNKTGKGKLTPAQRAARKAAAAQRAHNGRIASSVNRLDATQRARYRRARPKPPAGYAWSKGDRLVSTVVSSSAEGQQVAAVAGAPGPAKASRQSLRGSRRAGRKYSTQHAHSVEQVGAIDLTIPQEGQLSASTFQQAIDLALGHQWRHGWIPLTPAAALQKAHGSHAGAAKLLHSNGQEFEAHSMLLAGARHHELAGRGAKAQRFRVAAARMDPQKKLAAAMTASTPKPAPPVRASGPRRFTVEKVDQRLIDKGIAGGSTHIVRDNHPGPHGGGVAYHDNGRLAYFKTRAEAQRFAEAQNARHARGKAITPEEGHRRSMAQIDAKNRRDMQRGMEGIAAQSRTAHRERLKQIAKQRVAEKRALAANPGGDNLSALGVRKSGSKFEVFHTPSGKRISEHPTKSAAEATRQAMADTPHNLNVPSDQLVANKAAMEHLRNAAQSAASDANTRKIEDARVARVRKLHDRGAAARVPNPSKPGDVAVFSTKEHIATVRGSGASDVMETHTPGVVTHVGKDGRVLAIRDARGSLHTVDHRTEVRVLPQDQIDAQGFMAHVKATNRYGTSEHVKTSYDTLGDVQAAARPFRRDAPTPKAKGRRKGKAA